MQNDLVILGGGIAGVGTARLAARMGLKVTLVERSDLAAGASSSSSHMLHGGLRYLELGHVGLVRQALTERNRVMDLAPHLSRAGRFLVPLYAGQRIGLLRLRAGLALYDLLAGRRRLAAADILDAAATLEMEPGLATDGLRGAGVYSDGLMEDDALALAVAADARARGAQIRTWTEPIDAARTPDGGVSLTLRDRLGETPDETINARVLVNATGAWVDGVRQWLTSRLDPGGPAVQPRLRPSRGIHLIYPRLTENHGLLFFARSDGRVLFVVPFGERSLVGTTEVAVASPPLPAESEPSVAEVRYLRRELELLLPHARGRRPLALTSGFRPLLAADGEVGQASREHAVLSEGPVVSVAGGKYTTFRLMAADALAAALVVLGHSDRSRPAAEFDREPLTPPAGPAPGDGPETTLRTALEDGTARRVVDLLRRRTRYWLDDDGGRSIAPVAAELMGARHGWSAARRAEEISHYLELLDRDADLIRRSEEDV